MRRPSTDRSRRHWLRMGAAAILGAGIALVGATQSTARPTANNVGVQLGIGSLGIIEIDKTTVPRDFSLSVIATGDAPAPVTVELQLSSGLQLGAPAPGSAGTCSQTAAPVCTGTLNQTAGGTYAFWSWRMSSVEPGDYVVTASVTSPEVDPDLSDNSRSFRFTVAAPTSGGGGGGGGGGTSLEVSRAKISPATPRAGRSVVAAVRVTSEGSPVRPSRVTCAARAGAVNLEGKGKAASGSGSCTFSTTAKAKGKMLRGTISVRALGKTVRRTFSARLR